MRRTIAAWAVGVMSVACSSGDGGAGPSRPGTGGLKARDGGPSTDAAAGGSPRDGGVRYDQGPPWTPGVTLASTREVRRGLVDLRGLIHEHSVYSHDACDNKPRDASGKIDQQCFDDFRVGMCAAAHDFIMLSDHDTSFATTEFPEALLYRPERGDVLVDRAGGPVANRAACPTGSGTLILAGTESNTMPVGLEHHAADAATREALYASASPTAIAAFKAAGAVALVAHTENYTPDDLVTMPLDGFEMYNLHANLMLNIAGAVELLGKISQPDQVMHSDLVIFQVFTEDPRYLETWGTTLARGAHRVTTMGTDAHRNSLPVKLPDGDRVDSYGRMNRWFSNHLLVRPAADGSWDDRDLKDALRSGRLYGAFEYLGYPGGFDFHAEEGKAVREMGESASRAAGAQLVAHAPVVRNLEPSADPPEITVRLLRAREGGWDEVLRGNPLPAYTPDRAGAYRAEVRIVPHHLSGFLRAYGKFATADTVWVYSNPIYVTD